MQLDPPKITQKHYDPDVLCSSYKNQFKKPVSGTGDNVGGPLAGSHLVSTFEYKPKKAPFYSDT